MTFWEDEIIERDEVLAPLQRIGPNARQVNGGVGHGWPPNAVFEAIVAQAPKLSALSFSAKLG
jgi:hypothetical protein